MPGPEVVLWIVRHGETTGNRDGILQGQSDYYLTNTGRLQAVEAGKRLLPVAFDLAYSSDLVRAKETAEIILKELEPTCPGVELVLDKDLREIAGGARENRPLAMSMKEAIAAAAVEAGVPVEHFVPPPHETIKDLQKRAASFINRLLVVCRSELERRLWSDGPLNVLIVSHGGLLLQMYQKVFGATSLDRVLNASLTVIEVSLVQQESGGSQEGNGETEAAPPPSPPLGEEGKQPRHHPMLSWTDQPHFHIRTVNDVSHLAAHNLVTTRSTAL